MEWLMSSIYSLVNMQVLHVDETASTFSTLEISYVVSLMNLKSFSRNEAPSTLVATVWVLFVTTLVVNYTSQFSKAFSTFFTLVGLLCMCVNDLVHFKARLQSELSSTLVTTVTFWFRKSSSFICCW